MEILSMRKLVGLTLALGCAAALLYQAQAEQPGGKRGEGPAKKKAKGAVESDLVKRMMAFDKDKDGKPTRDEVTDPRLRRLFDRADKNKDGVVTKEELIALA